jgi:hypothetical protein
MTSEQELKKIFKAQQTDFADNGFSRGVQRRLPERNSILPQIIMFVCIAIGLTLTLAINGIAPILSQISALLSSIAHLQVPPMAAVLTYLSGFAILILIGYSVVSTE